MSTVTIDLVKEPEVAALLADKEPGDCVYGCFGVKSVDGQTAVLRLHGMASTREELPEHEGDDEDDETDESDDEKPAEVPEEKGTMGKRIADKLGSAGSGGY